MFAVPAYRGWLTMEQPDGSTIQVRQVGDEFYHYMVNEAGQRIKQNADGYYVVAGEVPTPEVAKARRAAAMARKNIRRAPKAVGTKPNLAPKGVVILVNFKDDAMQSAHTRAVFDELCNSTNCTVNKYNSKNYGSAAQYFADQSNGNYRPQFDVYGPVTLSRNVAYYGTDKDTGDPDKDEGDDQHATDAVVEACILADQKYSDLNFANYDSDKDGYVDFVYVIYAGQGQADGGATTTIWPHNWEIESAISSGYCTYPKAQCTIDGKKLNNYAMSGELSGSSLGGIGTLCHEFGHVMGLPDLYDTDYGDNYDNGITPGDWNIMDGGSYNGDGHCPPNYDPWQKYFFGWVTPVNLATEGKNITLLPNGTEGYQSYQINSANKLQTATTTGVNYYIENRQKQGWDAFIPTSGMLVWKINFNSSAWTNNEPNNTAGSPKYTIVPADGKIKDYGAAGDTYPTSTVRSYTPISGHEITDITKSGNNITFKYNGGQQKTECTYELLGEHCTYPADGVVAYNAALSLTITPESGYTLADPSCWTVEMGTNNELVYGEGFTYNAATKEFRIEHVTDDVAIMAEGKKQVTLTWMANGVQFAQTITAGSVVLPENEPEGCDGKVFVGWTKTANYESASTAPAFVKTGDAANQTIFYAVFATKGEGGGSETIEKASSVAVGDQVILVYESEKKELSGIGGGNTKYGEGADYTSTPAGAYLLEVVAGSEANTFALKHGSDYLQWASGNSLNTKTTIDVNSSWTITFSGGDATIKNASDDSRFIQWNASSPRFACYTSSQKDVQLYKKAGGGVSYSDYTTSCTPPCVGELTGITLNTTNVKKAFTEGETFNYTGLVVTANYDGCDSKIVVPTSVSTPDMSTIGKQTVTVTYEGKTATYEITISALPTYTIRFYNNGALVGTAQSVKQGQQPNVPATPSACEDYTFGGWLNASLTDDVTEKPSYVTSFTATKDQDYYAAYSYTEEGEGGGEPTIEKASSIALGDQVILVYESGKKELSGIAGSSTKYGEGTDYSSTPAGAYLLEVVAGSEASTFALKHGSEYLQWTSGNSLNVKTSIDANSSWTITFSSGNATIKNAADNTRLLQWNTGSPRFACYTSAQAAIQLYKKASSGPSSTTYYTTSPSCEACSAAVTVSKGETENGSFSLDHSGELSTCGGAVTITVTASPAEGYRFKEITQTGMTEGVTIDQTAKTVTYAKKSEGASTISVIFEAKPKYTVRFFANGQTLSTQTVIAGEKAEMPKDPSAPCDRYEFVGWWTEALAMDNTKAENWISDFTVTQAQDYYAIFSKTEEGTGVGESEVASVTFKTVGTDSSNESTDIAKDIVASDNGIETYDGTKVYAGGQGAKLGSSKASGSLTLTLATTVNVTAVKINASQYGTDTGTMEVTVGETSLGSQTPASGMSFEVAPSVETNTITIETTKRAYIASISVMGEGGTSSVTYYTYYPDCTSTAVESVETNEPVAVKAIINGQIVIIRGGAVYTLTGARVQ